MPTQKEPGQSGLPACKIALEAKPSSTESIVSGVA
jgi:hypothetical protein